MDDEIHYIPKGEEYPIETVHFIGAASSWITAQSAITMLLRAQANGYVPRRYKLWVWKDLQDDVMPWRLHWISKENAR